MLWSWCSAVPDSCLCGLKYLFEVAQGLRIREPWLGYPGLATGRNVQHPERHLQNPTSRDVFQAAVCYQPAPFDEGGMYPYCPAVPWMPRIPDFTDIPNMGVVLLSCIMASETTKVWVIVCSCRGKGPAGGVEPCNVASVWAAR
jgi:hypothetical protein